mgnify:FL=1
MNKFVIALATLIHLLPHPFGVSSIGATALYAGANGTRYIWLAPLIPLTLAALIFGFYEPLVMVFVFGGFALSSFAGKWFLQRKRNYARFGGAVATGAIVFYVASNFGIWLAGYYPQTTAGLVQCYINGLPFLGQSMLADAAFSFILFGAHSALERRQTEAVNA